MLRDLVLQNKTYRRFDSSYQVPASLIEQWIDLARISPTARNQQALKYLIVTDPQLRQELFPTLLWAGYLKDWPGPEPNERPTAYIVIGIDRNISDNYLAHWTHIDLGIAIQTILLAAAEHQLGGCVIVAMNKKKQRQLLQIPDYIDIQAVLAIGKPIEKVVHVPLGPDGDIRYWRDSQGTHYVPKRSLDDILLNRWPQFQFIKNV